MEGLFTYEDFDLLIEPGTGGSYRARVLRSPAGESTPVQFTVPFSAVELENLVLKVRRARRRTRGPGRPESAPLKDFGGKLYGAVFQDELRDTLLRSLSLTRSHGVGMRLRLRLTDTPELAELPWEFLYDRRLNRFLAQSRHTPLVRYLDLPDPPHPLGVEGPLRLLVMISSPSGYPTLDVEHEWTALTGALARPLAQGRVVVERLTANMSTLRSRLRREGFHIFHFVGHGFYRPDWGDGALVMEDRDGRPHEVTGEELGGLLNEYDLTRLAVLNACEGARSGASDPFAGIAQSLIQQGLPAVVAMQFEITDDAAIIFARELYAAIADGYPLEAALAEARGAIRDEGNLTEWGTPVLYSRAPDGCLFDLTGRAPVPEEPDRVAKELAGLYAQADAAAEARDWDQALTGFTMVADIDPGYRDIGERIANARKQQQIDRLQTEARHLHQAAQWAAVIEVGQRLFELDRAAADPGGLVALARAELAAAERNERFEADYQTALRQMNTGNLQEAIDTLEGIVQLAPDHHAAAALLDQARRQLAGSNAPEDAQSPCVLQVGQQVYAVAFSPDGIRLATGSRGRRVHIWNLQTGTVVQQLQIGRRDTVDAVAFSPDGTLLATGGSDKTARIWDAATGQQQLQVTHKGEVCAVAFSPDGTQLATGSDDKTARIWDIADR